MAKRRWYEQWFTEDYLNLYGERTDREAEEQVLFLVEQIPLSGKEKVLDLGCGAGRHVLAFGRRGFSVVGVDQSSSLLREARRKLAVDPGLDVTFYEADLLTVDLGSQFDLATSFFTSFGYGETEEENLKLLERIHGHLSKGGHFFIDYLHPDQVRRTLIPEEVREVAGERVVIHRSIEGELVVKRIAFPGRRYEERVRLYSREAIELLLKRSGFELVGIWGDFRGSSFGSASERQLFLARAI